jgi:AcrR family transcriptional regulator
MNESLMMPSKRSIPVQKRALAKYELILRVSCGLLEERGFSGLSTREIARRSDCNIATVYRYFDGVNDIIKALGETFFSGVSELFDQMSANLIRGDALDSVVQFFIEALTKELDENRWVLHAEAGIMTDLELIAWDRQLMQNIEIKLTGVLAIALSDKSVGDLQVISYRLVRHWKTYLRTLIEYEKFDEAGWLVRDITQTTLALIEADIG